MGLGCCCARKPLTPAEVRYQYQLLQGCLCQLENVFHPMGIPLCWVLGALRIPFPR